MNILIPADLHPGLWTRAGRDPFEEVDRPQRGLIFIGP